MATSFKIKNKFNDVKSNIDTGLHIGNVKIIPKRRGELFRRLRTKEMITLIQLFMNEMQWTEKESISNLINDDNDDTNTRNTFICHTEDDCTPHTITETESSFLLLDIRNEEDYGTYHIKTAKQYSPASLRRDKLGHDIYAFKNKPNKIIIICSNDPNQAIKFANDLCNKYIDNIFLLTSSVKRFAIKFPDLCVGDCLPKKETSDDSPKATVRYVDYRPPTGNRNKYKKIRMSSNSEMSATMSVCSNATTRTWKP
eukprot:231004_1